MTPSSHASRYASCHAQTQLHPPLLALQTHAQNAAPTTQFHQLLQPSHSPTRPHKQPSPATHTLHANHTQRPDRCTPHKPPHLLEAVDGALVLDCLSRCHHHAPTHSVNGVGGQAGTNGDTPAQQEGSQEVVLWVGRGREGSGVGLGERADSSRARQWG